MRTILAVVISAVAILGFAPAAAESGSSLPRQVAIALRTARQAEHTALVALAASKRPAVPVKGDAGSPGARGVDGLNGAPGGAGSNGTNGTTGLAGRDGKDGSAGATGPVGPVGAKGDQGATGAPGPMGISLKAYGHVTTDGNGTNTQGATFTHPGLGLYCMADQGFVAVVLTPDSWNSTAFALPPSDPHGSCGSSAWTIAISNNGGVDTGFYFLAN